MTRLWDSSLGSGKRDAMSHGGRKDEARAPQADRPRWAQPLPSGSWVRTEAPSCRKEICPLKAGTLRLPPSYTLLLACSLLGGA